MPTRSASCRASASVPTAYPVSSNSLLDGEPDRPYPVTLRERSPPRTFKSDKIATAP
jgi:hypothetical protein